MRVIKSIEEGKASNLVAQSIRNGGRVISPQYKTTLCNQVIYSKADKKFFLSFNFFH